MAMKFKMLELWLEQETSMVVSNTPSTSSLKELGGDKTTGKKMK